MLRSAGVVCLLLFAARWPATGANSGIITTIAGNGTAGYSGDGGAATAASFNDPMDVAVDPAGNLFIVDPNNHRVREVAAGTGIVTTVAGNGVYSYSGDGGPAPSAGLSFVAAVALDSAGNFFIADLGNQRVRRVDAATGIITTVAGNGASGFTGDGGPAASASLNSPAGVAIDGAGNIFVADQGNNRVRRVDAATGIITTVAGNGVQGLAGDGGPATAASLGFPTGLALDAAGNVFIADQANSVIRRLDHATGIITTIAGNGAPGFSGDGGAAITASLYYPEDVAVDAAGNVFIAEPGNGRIRRVEAATGIITTVAGNGACCFSGDGGPATSAALNSPTGIAVDGNGNLFIADEMNQRVRRVTPQMTSTSVIADFNQAPFGQTLTFTATVSPAAATGTVQFLDGGSSLGTASLSGGSAAISTSALSAGTHSITAVYGGDAVYLASTSPVWTETVKKVDTSSHVSADVNPSAPGQTVTFTAYISPASATGTFQLFDGTAALGTASITNGTASISTSSLGLGSHSITAVYSGDVDYNGSTSPAWTQKVATGTSTTLASNVNPSIYGQAVTFAAAVSPSSATGTVEFWDGSNLVGTSALNNGSASVTTAGLATGSHSIIARYDGDPFHYASSSPIVTQLVNKAPTSTTLGSSADPSLRGQQVTFTAQVSSASASGAVQFFDGSTLLGGASLNSGSASFTTSALAIGTHSITARYAGDGNFSGSASAALTQTVKRKL